MALDRKLGAIALAALALSAAAPALADGPFENVRVAANRAEHRGACPVAIVYTATVNLRPHRGVVFQYHWQRSDGAKSPSQVVRARNGENSFVFREEWRVGGRGTEGDFSDAIVLASGTVHERVESPPVHVRCR